MSGAKIAGRTLLLGAISLAAVGAGIPPAELTPIQMVYRVAYDNPDLNMDAKPFAQRILDLEQPGRSTVTIRPLAERPGFARLEVEEVMLNRTLRVTDLTFQVQPELRWTNLTVVQRNLQGRVFRRETYDLAHPAFRYPPEMISPFGFWMLAPTLNLSPGFKRVFLVFMNPWIMARTTAKVEGRETVTVPAGRFECWKISFTIWAGDYFGSAVGALVQPFAPRYTVWMETNPPYKIIKYRGALGEMPSTTSIWESRELISFR